MTAPLQEGRPLQRGCAWPGHAWGARSLVYLLIAVSCWAVTACRRAPQSVLEIGREHYQNREFSEAAVCFQQHLEQQPDDAQVWQLLGQTRLALKDPEGAEQALTQAVELDPENATLYSARSVARDRAGNEQGALEDHRRAAELHFDYHSRLNPTRGGEGLRRDPAAGTAELERQLAPERAAAADRPPSLEEDEDQPEGVSQLGNGRIDWQQFDAGTPAVPAPEPRALTDLVPNLKMPGSARAQLGLEDPAAGGGEAAGRAGGRGPAQLLQPPRTTIPPGVLGPPGLSAPAPQPATIVPAVIPRLGGVAGGGLADAQRSPDEADPDSEPEAEDQDASSPPGRITPRYAVPPGSYDIGLTPWSGNTLLNPLYEQRFGAPMPDAPPQEPPPGRSAGGYDGSTGIRRDRDLTSPLGGFSPYGDEPGSGSGTFVPDSQNWGGYGSGGPVYGSTSAQQAEGAGSINPRQVTPRQGPAMQVPITPPDFSNYDPFTTTPRAPSYPGEGTGYYQPRFDYGRDQWKMQPLDRAPTFRLFQDP